MRIAINGLAITRTMTGIGRVTLQSLRAMLDRDRDNEYLLFLPSDAPDDLGLEAANLTLVPTDVSLTQPFRSTWFETFELPRRLKGARIDLFYAPSYLLPAVRGARAEIVCIHDLAWRFHPRSKSLRFRTYMNARLPTALKRAERIVCVSQATSSDLQAEYGDNLGPRIRVVHNGVDLDRFRPGPTSETGRDAYIAVVGNQDPRKNIATLFEAFPSFRARLRPCRLVMVGPGPAPRSAPAAVDCLGYLDDPELVSLYRGALMVVQPSLYEGFGLPVLEAMACGAPVACADIPVFREIAGDCVRYFNPRDARGIADAMAELAGDDLVRRALAEKGAERAKEFSWDRSAERLLRVFTEAIA
ncbi:MAG: glycosyltransferase family 4 protein [Planctomycetota bacterium]|jgi:glycosyltransferase involved in cell wall biosynthesis